VSHSGCNGGKKWASLTLKKTINGEEYWARKIIEKYAGTDAVIFNSVAEARKRWPHSDKDRRNGYFLRPQKLIDLEEEWLSQQDTFNYEGHLVKVFDKVLKRPLFFRRKKE